MGLLGSAIGSAAGGVLGGIFGGSGDVPTANYNAPTENEQAKYNLAALNKSANKSQAEFEQQAQQGLGAGKDIQSQVSQAGSPEMSAALKARAGKSYNADLARMSRQQNIGALDTRMGELSTAQALNFREAGINENVRAYQQAAKAQSDAYDQEMDSARNAAIASVLGSAGKWGGMALAQGKGTAASPSSAEPIGFGGGINKRMAPVE
jgi:hypothetical protein